jgi:repressor LexA
MQELTQKQNKVLEFIRKQQIQGRTPTFREIATFMETSLTAAADQVRALKKKGVLKADDRAARSLKIVSPMQHLKKRVVDIPIFNSVPASFPKGAEPSAKGCVSVDVNSVRIKVNGRAFAVEVRGNSVLGKHILPGDLVICERGISPKDGDVVAAMIDRESAVKVFVTERGKPCLKSDTPKSRPIPVSNTMIQGVMVGLIRRRS